MASYTNYPLPASAVAKKSVAKALVKTMQMAKEDGKQTTDIDVVVNAGCSHLHMVVGKSPPLSKARSRSFLFWSLNMGRALTATEMMRLQGYDPSKVRVNISKSQLGAKIGAATTCTVLRKVMAGAIEAAEG